MGSNLEIYKCLVCRTVVEVIERFGPELVCCGRPMERFPEQKGGLGRQRHSPIMELVDQGLRVSVGPLPHVMTPRHHIEWIEVLSGGRRVRQYLRPGQKPVATFDVRPGRAAVVRVYCSVHGLWRSLPGTCCIMAGELADDVVDARAL
jgi:superoxide reductase